MANPTAQYTLPDWIDKLSIEYAVKLLLFGFYGGSAPSSGQGLPVTGQTVTPHFVELSASGSQVIPAGAKGWTATILTGTGTIGGKAVPAGFSDGDTNTLAASVTVTTDGASTAYVRWNT